MQTTVIKTANRAYSDAEDRKILSSFVGTKHRNVTEGRTDRQTDGLICRGYYSALHCSICSAK